eukprot:scaffold51641_cov63-Phaeocystis_antarctica.AAC.1
MLRLRPGTEPLVRLSGIMSRAVVADLLAIGRVVARPKVRGCHRARRRRGRRRGRRRRGRRRALARDTRPGEGTTRTVFSLKGRVARPRATDDELVFVGQSWGVLPRRKRGVQDGQECALGRNLGAKAHARGTPQTWTPCS